MNNDINKTTNHYNYSHSSEEDNSLRYCDSLSLFKKNLRSIKKLNREEELEISLDFYNNKNIESVQKLISHNLYVVYIYSLKYSHYNIPQMDIIQQGSIGLMKAVKRFNPNKGFRLSTFASHWIVAEINDYILANWSMVKVGTSKLRRNIFYGLGKAKEKIAAMTGVGIEEVAKKYNIKSKEYKVISNALLKNDVSIEGSYDEEGSNIDSYLIDSQCVESDLIERQEKNNAKEKIKTSLSHLEKRDEIILRKRHLNDDKTTLIELGKEFGISIERVRQLEKRALKRLKEHIVLHNMEPC